MLNMNHFRSTLNVFHVLNDIESKAAFKIKLEIVDPIVAPITRPPPGNKKNRFADCYFPAKKIQDIGKIFSFFVSIDV